MTGNVNIDNNDTISTQQIDPPFSDAERRFAVVRLLTSLFVNDNGDMNSSERALHEDVLKQQIDESGVMIRSEVAERLASISRPPRKVVRELIRDEIGVARSLLLHSPALTDDELIEVAHATSLEHRLMIAQRPEISGLVVDVLMCREEPVILLAVARNLGATIEEDAHARISLCSRRDEELANAYAKRSENDIGPMCELFWAADESLRHHILDNTPETANDKSDLKYAPIRVSGIVERRDALEGLAALLTSQRQLEFQLFLSQMLGISQRLTSRIISDPGGEPFAVACKAAGFPGNAFTTLLLLYNPEVSQSVQRVFALSDLYENFSKSVSWHLLELWHEEDRSGPEEATLDLRPTIHEPIATRVAATRVTSTPEHQQVQIPTANPEKRAVFGRRS